MTLLAFCLGLAQATPRNGTPPDRTHSVSLSWAAPGHRTDGSLMRSGDIAGYRIYIGKRSGTYAESIEIDSPEVTEYTVRGLERGVYRFAVTVLDVFGNESPLSRETSYRVQ